MAVKGDSHERSSLHKKVFALSTGGPDLLSGASLGQGSKISAKEVKRIESSRADPLYVMSTVRVSRTPARAGWPRPASVKMYKYTQYDGDVAPCFRHGI